MLASREDVGSAINVADVGADPVVRGNTISRADIGIWVENGALPLIVDNVLTDNQTGISVEGSSPLLSGNTICDNETNVQVSGGAEKPDGEGNEICVDGAAASTD